MGGEGEDDEGDRDGHRPGPPGRPRQRLLGVGAAAVDRQPLPQLEARDDAGAGVGGGLALGVPQRPGREHDAGQQDQQRRSPGASRRRTRSGRRTPRRARDHHAGGHDGEQDPERTSGTSEAAMLPRYRSDSPSAASRGDRRRGPAPHSSGAPAAVTADHHQRGDRQQQHRLAQRVDADQPAAADEHAGEEAEEAGVPGVPRSPRSVAAARTSSPAARTSTAGGSE